MSGPPGTPMSIFVGAFAYALVPMPDWFYRTVAQPLLFRLPPTVARGLALGLLAGIERFPGGGRVIDFLGHLRAAPELAVTVGGHRYASPLVLGWRVDPERRASTALARFGVGGLEVLESPFREVVRMADGLRDSASTVRLESPKRTFIPRPALPAGHGFPLFTRWVQSNGEERLRAPGGGEWPVLGWSTPPATGSDSSVARGVVLQVGARDGSEGWKISLRPPTGLVAQVRAWRAALGIECPLIVAGGIAEPADAVALREAGADLLLVDAGLVFSGPGLVKRCNAALLATRRPLKAADAPLALSDPARFRQSWFWAATLGAALAAGGALTLFLAFTRVLLPYDEHYLGLSISELARANPRLVTFMAHDRATLAGVMLGLGWLYWVLARAGIRQGDHATWCGVAASAATGFASFFYFLGFGYFDPLHAFVTGVLFQLLLLVLTGAQVAPVRGPCLDLREDAIWRRAQWGQLLLVLHAFGLLFAGSLISFIGLTQVFVSEDLAFLCIGPGQVSALGERVLAVVAHDRATLGGMLLACGLASLLPTLWNFDRGARWLRRAFVGLGAPAYTGALGIHYSVGYLDWHHLAPAWLGAILGVLGLALAWDYLGETAEKADATSVDLGSA